MCRLAWTFAGGYGFSADEFYRSTWSGEFSVRVCRTMQSMITDDTDYLSNVAATRTPTLTRLSDEQGVHRFFNESWLKFTGHSIDDTSGNGWLRAVHADDRPAVLAAYRGRRQRRPMLKFSSASCAVTVSIAGCWIVPRHGVRSTAVSAAW